MQSTRHEPLCNWLEKGLRYIHEYSEYANAIYFDFSYCKWIELVFSWLEVIYKFFCINFRLLIRIILRITFFIVLLCWKVMKKNWKLCSSHITYHKKMVVTKWQSICNNFCKFKYVADFENLNHLFILIWKGDFP